MAERQRTRLQFGQGLDRETGVMATKPGSMEDLRNVYLRRGKLVARKGVKSKLTFNDTDGNPITHILAGQAIRGLRIGLVVGYQGDDTVADAGKVFIYRLDADATIQTRLTFGNDPANPEWFTVSNPASADPPTVITAEVFGKAFFAHDTFAQADREPTLVYDPFAGAELDTMDLDLDGDGTKGAVKFRGVQSHLDYLFGWGYGSETEPRPELLRVSRPGAPTNFAKNHYFIIGSRRDPVVAAKPAGGNMVVLKENELHVVTGSGQHNFGAQKVDSRFGCIGTRLAIAVQGQVLFWSIDGPRITDGGPSQLASVPLELKGFEPSDLPATGDLEDGFAEYIPEEQIAIWCFDQRVYALNLRGEARGWTYWDLGFTPECAFTLYGATTGSQSTAAPQGNSDFTGHAFTKKTQSSVEIEFNNENVDGDELIEIWRRPVANHAWPEWLHAPSDTGGTSGVADGWADGVTGTPTVNYALDDPDSDGNPERQQIEVTAGAAGDQGYVEKTITGLSAGDTWRISAHYIAENLTDLEGRIQIAWLQSDDTVISTTNVTGLIDAADGGLRAYISEAAPANTAKIRVRLIAHVTGASPSGSLYFRRVLVHNDSNDGAWERADTVNVALTTQTEVVSGAQEGWFYEFALRHKRSAQYTTGYTSSDPNDWPDEAKALTKHTMAAPIMDAVEWERTGGSEITATVKFTPNMALPHDVTVGGGVEADVSGVSIGQQESVEITNPAVDPETYETFNAQVDHPDGIQTFPGVSITRWMGPVAPSIEFASEVGSESTGLHWKIQGGGDSYGAPPDSECATELADSVDGITNYETPTSEGATSGQVSYPTQSSGTDIDIRARHVVTTFGVEDRSDFDQVTVTVP